MTIQFTCCVRIEEIGELMPIYQLITPPVTVSTKTEGIYHPETVKYCEENKCSVYEIVR